MEFTLNGEAYDLSHQQVEDAMREVPPEPVRKHFVTINGREYPIKQIITQLFGLSKLDFTTQQARSIVKRLGFDVSERKDASHDTRGEASMTSKYEPLHRYLKALTDDDREMSFAEIETILGFALPPSARQYKEWWSNPTDDRQHSYSRAWLDAGVKARHVNLGGERVTFIRE